MLISIFKSMIAANNIQRRDETDIQYSFYGVRSNIKFIIRSGLISSIRLDIRQYIRYLAVYLMYYPVQQQGRDIRLI